MSDDRYGTGQLPKIGDIIVNNRSCGCRECIELSKSYNMVSNISPFELKRTSYSPVYSAYIGKANFSPRFFDLVDTKIYHKVLFNL